MNSRQRVLKALNRQEPDRVPVGEWGIDHDNRDDVLYAPRNAASGWRVHPGYQLQRELREVRGQVVDTAQGPVLY